MILSCKPIFFCAEKKKLIVFSVIIYPTIDTYQCVIEHFIYTLKMLYERAIL
jgi:hypothetical protein